MRIDDTAADIRAIESLIARQFASLSWTPEKPADWNAFAADFLPGALLYPAARPVRSQTVPAFIERMKELAGTKLRSFHETVLGTEIRVFGNIAVAQAACEMIENGTNVNRSVEMLLLVKNDGAWRIASQTWDTEKPATPIPVHLARGASAG